VFDFKPLFALEKAHSDAVRSLVLTPDAQHIVSGGGAEVMRSRLVDGKCSWQRELHERKEVLGVALTPDGKYVISGGRDSCLRRTPCSDGRFPEVLERHKDAVGSVATKPDGNHVASSSLERVTVVRLSDRRIVQTLDHAEFVWCLAYALDGAHLLAATGPEVWVWGASETEPVRTLQPHTTTVTGIAAAPDGRYILSAHGTMISVWQASDGKLVRELNGHSDWIRAMTILADGQHLLSCGDDEILNLWRLSDGKPMHSQRQVGRIYSLAATPDRLVCGMEDGSIRLWSMM